MSQGRKTASHPALFLDATRVYAHIPQDPFYTRLAALLDWEFIYAETAGLYAPALGRPSLDPVVFFKCLLFGFFENIIEDSKLALRLAESLTARRLLGYGLEERTPDESTLRKTRHRMPAEVFTRVFEQVLAQCAAHGLVRGRALGVDSSTVEANASLDSLRHRTLGCTYQEYLAAVRASAGEAAGAAALAAPVPNRVWVSATDPDAKVARMKAGQTDLAYKINTAVDLETGVIVAAGARTAETNDHQDLLPWVDQATAQLATVACTPQVVVTDRGYHSGENLADLADRGLVGLLASPEYRSSTPEFPATAFAPDPATDTLVCPQGVVLLRRPTDEARAADGRRIYRAQGRHCRACPHFGTCTTSRQGRSVTVLPYGEEREANALRCRTPAARRVRAMRHPRCEAPFGYFKQFGGLRRVMSRGLDAADKRVVIAALGWNLLKLLKRLAARGAHGQQAAVRLWRALRRWVRHGATAWRQAWAPGGEWRKHPRAVWLKKRLYPVAVRTHRLCRAYPNFLPSRNQHTRFGTSIPCRCFHFLAGALVLRSYRGQERGKTSSNVSGSRKSMLPRLTIAEQSTSRRATMTDPQQPYQPADVPQNPIPPPPSLSSAVSPPSAEPQRPVAATSIGVVLLIFAFMGLASFIFRLIQMNTGTLTPSPIPSWLAILSMVIGVLSTVAQAIMGIGLLRVLPWARVGTIVTFIVLFVLSAVISILKVTNAQITQMTMPNNPVTPSVMHGIMIGSAIFGLIITAAIYGLMIYFLTRPNVVAAFEKRQ